MSSQQAMGENQKGSAKISDEKRESVPLPLAPDQSDKLQSDQKKITMGSGTITRRISAGGMAIIYEIWNQELEVTRAVKLLRPDHTQESAERFQTEMKISAKLHHPNIIEIYAVGKWNSLPYIEMERIDGYTLEKVIAHAGSLPLEVCTSVAIMVGRALNYAHNQLYVLYGKNYKGIIHRDLKPSNVMITKRGTVKLMDFGIAKPVTASIHTCTDVVIGTLQYLAPEQLQGEDADFRSDLYSLGTVIYEMLTGKQAFPEAGLAKLVPSKLDNTYIPLEMYKKKIPRNLREIVHKSLRLEPNKRYQSTLELLRALGKVHKKLTNLSPEQVMAKYMQAPRQPETIVIRKKSRFFTPLLIWASSAAALTIFSLTFVFYSNPEVFSSITNAAKGIHARRIADHFSTAKNMFIYYTNRFQGERPGTDTKIETKSATTSANPNTSSLSQSVPQETHSFLQDSTDSHAYSDALGTGNMVDASKNNTQSVSHGRSLQMGSEKPIEGKQELLDKETNTKTLQQEKTAAPPSLIDRLRFQYGVDDPAEIFIAEVEKREYDNALKIYKHLKKDELSQTKVQIYRFRALLNAGSKTKAKEMLMSQDINDGEFLLEKAMYLYRTDRHGEARKMVERASRAPVGFMNKTTFRQRLLFTKALCSTSSFESAPSPETRRLAMEAWFEVKSYLRTSPDHRYFQEADKQIRRISRN